MKIRSVIVNQRKAQLEVVVANGTMFPLPFSQLSLRPTSANRILDAYPDKELAKEALTYVLESDDLAAPRPGVRGLGRREEAEGSRMTSMK